MAVGERAWYERRKESWLTTERLLNEATQLDPDSADAYATLILVEYNLWLWENGERGARLRRDSLARQAFENTVRLNAQANLERTHEEQSGYYFYILRDFEKAFKEWETWHPNTVRGDFRLAVIDRRRGRWTDSIRRFGEYEQDHPHTIWGARETARTFAMVRRYSEGEGCLKEALTKAPEGVVNFYRQLGEFRLAQADPQGASEFFARAWEEIQKQPRESTMDESGACHSARIIAALYLRDYNSALQLVASAPANLIDSTVIFDPTPNLQPWFRAQIHRAQNGAASARSTFAAARREAEAQWGDSDAIPAQLSLLACIDAGAGHKEDAIREAKRALEMCPIDRDAQDGPYLAENLALVYAWTSEHDLAIEQLEALAKIPCGPSYGDLKLNPKWDDLRGDPRFERMVESLTPKS